MKRYVLGVTTPNEKEYVMLEKINPEWQKGYLNFPGGKIESDEQPISAVIREIKEEIGVFTEEADWTYIGKLSRLEDFEIYVFYSKSDKFYYAQTMEQEKVSYIQYQDILENNFKFMPNIKWIVDFIRCSDRKKYNTTFNVDYGLENSL